MNLPYKNFLNTTSNNKRMYNNNNNNNSNLKACFFTPNIDAF